VSSNVKQPPTNLNGRFTSVKHPHKLSHSFSGALRTFSYWVAAGSVGLPLLEGLEYRQPMLEEPSLMEMAYAIFANVIEFDEHGEPVNAKYAEHRAAQYIRSYCDPTYVVAPPFEAWEQGTVWSSPEDGSQALAYGRSGMSFPIEPDWLRSSVLAERSQAVIGPRAARHLPYGRLVVAPTLNPSRMSVRSKRRGMRARWPLCTGSRSRTLGDT
jgi:hypothetical protein